MTASSMSESREIVLFGASVRSLAASAARAGYRPIAVDLFADWDLRQFAETRQASIKDYPAGFLHFVDLVEGRPWMITGGLENAPDVLERLAARGECLGPSVDAIRSVRDPRRLDEWSERAGARRPAMAFEPRGLPTDGSWLVKPLGGAAGRGISPWMGGAASTGNYWQRLEEGSSRSALFVASAGAAKRVGMSQQWIGRPECHAPPFGYCGNVGPIEDAGAAEPLNRLGNLLASEAGLVGVFGIDYLAGPDGPVVLEVNPRWPASAEVYEAASGENLFLAHLAACRGRPLDESAFTFGSTVGKAILYAPFDAIVRGDAFVFREWSPSRLEHSSSRDGQIEASAWFADLPWPGSRVAAGEPVLTALAKGTSVETVERALLASLGRVIADVLLPAPATVPAP